MRTKAVQHIAVLVISAFRQYCTSISSSCSEYSGILERPSRFQTE